MISPVVCFLSMFDNHLDGESWKNGLIHMFIKAPLMYVCIADLSVG